MLSPSMLLPASEAGAEAAALIGSLLDLRCDPFRTLPPARNCVPCMHKHAVWSRRTSEQLKATKQYSNECGGTPYTKDLNIAAAAIAGTTGEKADVNDHNTYSKRACSI